MSALAFADFIVALPEEQRRILWVLWNSWHPSQFKDERPKAAALHLVFYTQSILISHTSFGEQEGKKLKNKDRNHSCKENLSYRIHAHDLQPALSCAKLHVEFPMVFQFDFGIWAF